MLLHLWHCALALKIPHAILGIVSRKRTALMRCHAIICETMNIYPQAVPKAALSCIDELAMRPLAELYRYSRMILMTHNCNPNEIVVSLKLTIAYR